jgi:transcriptional regulator with PAS, ATPase and Fis domain
LRVLEENVIERVGENKPIQVDVRIVTATNRDLERLVKKGLFREDLFYRINVIPIAVPPLRERVEDIPLLAETFFRRVRMKSGKDIQGISEEAMKKLVDYPWPGNVRELKSAFEYAFVSCQDSVIHPHHLPPGILWGQKEQEGATTIPVNRDEVKKRQLLDALEKAGGNQSEAARILNVSRVTVWNRMKKFNINLRRKIGV